MKKIIIASLIAASSSFAQVKGDVEVPYIPFKIKMGKGFETVNADCLMCHSFGYVLNQGYQPREFWREKIHKMIKAFKAPIPKEDIPVIEDYLTKHYGVGK